MATVSGEKTTLQFRQPSRLKTSEVLRETASWLTALAGVVAAELDQLASELRVRASWIEGARHDEGVSGERRLAIAAIEDVDTSTGVGRRA